MTQAAPVNASPAAASPAKAVPVVVVTPDDPILQAILAALNTALNAIHTWAVASQTKT